MARLSGLKKVAVLIISLAPSEAATLLRHLRPSEVEDITVEIANMKRVDPALQRDVLTEFYHLAQAGQQLVEGGVDAARRILEEAFGTKTATEMMHKLTALWQRRPFDLLRRADPQQIQLLLANEYPQTIALVLAYLDPAPAAQILSLLPDDLRRDVARRIAVMEPVSPEILRDVEVLMNHKLSALAVDEVTTAGGVNTIVPILNNLDRASERMVLHQLAQTDPELADDIRNRMFVFENIVLLDDLAVQKTLRRVDTKTLAMALKGTSPDVSQKILKNLSQKAAELLKEDTDVLGPVRIRDVEQAQRDVVAVIRQLENDGEIVISRGRDDEFIS